MAIEKYIHDQKSMISPHTNRPITTITTPPVFWCGTCCLKLKTAYMALQHMRGRSHNAKLNNNKNTANQSNQKDTIKRTNLPNSSTLRQVRPVVTKVSTSVVNKQPGKMVVLDGSLQCNLCNLVFHSNIIATQHFQGKKHVAAMHSYMSTIRFNNIAANKNYQNNVKIQNVLVNINNAKQVEPVLQESFFKKSQIQPTKAAVSDSNLTCADCNLVLNSTTTAIQHYKGKRHATTIQLNEAKIKNNAVNQNNQNLIIQRNHLPNLNNARQVGPVFQGSSVKKREEQVVKAVKSDPNLTCNDCNLVFNSSITAVQHFNGKRHAEPIQLYKTTNATQNLANQNDANRVPKRKHLLELSDDVKPAAPDVEDSPAKKNKEDTLISDAPEKNLKCDDCNIGFNCALSASQHYQGKKHAKTVAANIAAMQNETMSRWQNRDAARGPTRGARGFDRGRARGNSRSGGSMSIGGQYRKHLLDHKAVSSNMLLRKAILPGKFGSLMNTEESVIKPCQLTQKYFHRNPSDNIINLNMLHNKSTNKFGSVQRNDFYGNPSPSNCGTPQLQLKDNQSQSNGYFTCTNIPSQKDMYDSRNQSPPNDYYNNRTLIAASKDNVNNGRGRCNYYSNDHGSNEYCNPSDGYGNTHIDFSSNSDNGYQMSNARINDTFYSET